MSETKVAELFRAMRSKSVRSFTASVDCDKLVFEPIGAFDRELADGSDEVLWLVSKQDSNDDLQEIARVRIAREATQSAVVDGFKFTLAWSSLAPEVRVIRHVATLATASDDWYDMAAEKLGITLAELASWIEWEPPPEDLSSRLAVFVPRLRNEAFRMRTRAQHAYMLVEFLDPSNRGSGTKSCDEEPAGRHANRRVPRVRHHLNNNR